MTENNTNLTGRRVGDVSGLAEVQNEIDELRAKMRKLVQTTSCMNVEASDHYLAKAMSELEEYFEWAGCYDDEPEVKAMSERKEIDQAIDKALQKPTTQFVRCVVSWENNDGKQTADFVLPIDEDPHQHVGSLLNLVELDADDFGYDYDLEFKPVDNTRESLDSYQAHLLKRIRESEEPIPVRGIFHKPE